MLRPVPAILLALCLAALVPSQAQSPASSAPPNPSPLKLDLPDSPAGLERLAKEIFKAQKEGDSARASALAQTMVLPDPGAWYLATFGRGIANDEGAKYVADRDHVPNEILSFFFGALQNHNTEVTAARFTDSCDDNAGESAFGTLQLRRQPVPLYELRLRNGDHFLRFFAVAYVDGAFRFVLAPRVANHFPDTSGPGGNANAQNGAMDGSAAPRFRQNGMVTAARILNKVTPEYPHLAREEHLSGTVRMHAIIDKSGAVSQLVVLQGYCSLAKVSLDAVRK